MKRAKYALGAIVLIGGLAGVLAFKSHKAPKFYYIGAKNACKWNSAVTTTTTLTAPVTYVTISVTITTTTIPCEVTHRFMTVDD
jgi:hypothetical protein